MSSWNFIICLLKSHGCDTPTLKQLPSENILLSKIVLDVPTTAAAASINKIQVNKEDGLLVQPVPDNNDDEDNSCINQNSLKDDNIYWKLSNPMSLLLSDCIKQVYLQEGMLENTTTHLVLKKKSGFNYQSLLSELIYAYITC